MKQDATNSLRSMTSGVLLVSSHTTRKSVIPRRPWISRRNGSTMFVNSARVKSSFSSNITFFAASPIARSMTRNSRRTLMRSNADGRDSAVLSPNSTVPWPQHRHDWVDTRLVHHIAVTLCWVERKCRYTKVLTTTCSRRGEPRCRFQISCRHDTRS